MMFQGDMRIWEFAERTQHDSLTDELVIFIYILILYLLALEHQTFSSEKILATLFRLGGG